MLRGTAGGPDFHFVPLGRGKDGEFDATLKYCLEQTNRASQQEHAVNVGRLSGSLISDDLYAGDQPLITQLHSLFGTDLLGFLVFFPKYMTDPQ